MDRRQSGALAVLVRQRMGLLQSDGRHRHGDGAARLNHRAAIRPAVAGPPAFAFGGSGPALGWGVRPRPILVHSLAHPRAAAQPAPAPGLPGTPHTAPGARAYARG